jgi:hypothetical protein
MRDRGDEQRLQPLHLQPSLRGAEQFPSPEELFGLGASGVPSGNTSIPVERVVRLAGPFVVAMRSA